MEEDDQAERGVHMPAGVSSQAERHESPAGQKERKVSRKTRRAVLEHPLLAVFQSSRAECNATEFVEEVH